MLIDCSYFTAGPRHIQNVSLRELPKPGGDTVNDAVEEYISLYQERYLCRVLGSTLGRRVNGYLLCKDEGDSVKSEHYDEVCSWLREPFAYYVFFNFLRDYQTTASTAGVTQQKKADRHVAPIQRQVAAWNAMVDHHRDFAAWAASGDCPLGGIEVVTDMLTKINTLNL